MEPINEFPEGWGEDRLSDFQHQAFGNELWSFANETVFTKLLTDCDSLIFESLLNVFPKQTEEANLGSLLLINSHNHFRASARLCMSGQCLPVYPTARACLETAVYGWFLITYPEKVKEWLRKPEAEDELREWNRTFRFSSINNRIRDKYPDSALTFKELHQMAIDFGGHPNRKALFSNLSSHPDDRTLQRVAYMHSDGILLHYTFNFMFDIALSMLTLIKLAYKPLGTDEEFAIKAEALVFRALEQRNLFKLKLNSSDQIEK